MKTKAETLLWLKEQGFPVPDMHMFSVEEWLLRSQAIVEHISGRFPDCLLAVRSSSRGEDGSVSSGAGAFTSVLNVPSSNASAMRRAIENVRISLRDGRDQIFVQPMISDVIMSGVVMTRHLDDGSPYYVVNYDDATGRTDTVTSGAGVSKTVFLYKWALDSYYDSPRLRKIAEMTRRLEECYVDVPLDIEFAMDKDEAIHLLQTRRICSTKNWPEMVEDNVHKRIQFMETFVEQILGPRHGLFGRRSMLGVMPDWNPAEMIGIAPRPLAASLYRCLITKRTWSLAREKMGYMRLPPVELMLSVAGRPYIDIRASFNSFLPDGLSPILCERLVNAWVDRLDAHPGFHDKIEFDIVHTVADPDFPSSFRERFPGLLSPSEFGEYHSALLGITISAVSLDGSLGKAMRDLDALSDIQKEELPERAAFMPAATAFDLVLMTGKALEECRNLGTMPFAIIARHAFIAESFLRSMVRAGALGQGRVDLLKQSFNTVTTQFSRDFRAAGESEAEKRSFLRKYGHLRPGTYDILSRSYSEREDLFSLSFPHRPVHDPQPFILRAEEKRDIEALFRASFSSKINPETFLAYATRAIAGRELAKFIFTRHVSHVLDLLLAWGRLGNMTREEIAMLSIDNIIEMAFNPLRLEWKKLFREHIRDATSEYELMRSFKMAYIIRSVRDIYIVPQHRSTPNFITSRRVRAEVSHLGQNDPASIPLDNRIVCIESADPGYDWIFTRNIAGLITRYGGTNSHMAIRCAEYNLPAAIGCGELLFEKVVKSRQCILDCAARSVTPLDPRLEIEMP